MFRLYSQATHQFYRKLFNILTPIVYLKLCLNPPTHVLMVAPPHSYVITISSSVQSCKTIPPLSSSDDLGLQLQSQWKQASQPQCHSDRIIWRYAHADWQKLMTWLWKLTGNHWSLVIWTHSGTISRIEFLKSWYPSKEAATSSYPSMDEQGSHTVNEKKEYAL